jgi:hypothetical protein
MERFYGLLPLLLWAPDGAGGGGTPPGEIPLDDWIRRLNEAEREDWKAIVEELAGTLGIKTNAVFKKLKAAGWDPKNNDKNFNNDTAPPAAGERPGPDGTGVPVDTRPGSSEGAEGPAVGGNPPRPGDPSPGNTPVTPETSLVTLRHKSPYPHYRRAGLLLTGRWKSYAVTAEQRAALENDAWVEIQKPKEPAGFQGPDKT